MCIYSKPCFYYLRRLPRSNSPGLSSIAIATSFGHTIGPPGHNPVSPACRLGRGPLV